MFSKSKFRIAALSLLAAAALTAPSMSSSATKKRAFILSHFHYDPVWTNSQAGETMRAFSLMRQNLDYAAEEPAFKPTFSEIDYLKPYLDAHPRDRAKLLSLTRSGRAELTGGYNEPDEAAVGGEALIRNFVMGKVIKESIFGATVRTAAQLDVFGHTPQLPQILRKSGHDFELHTRGNLTDLPAEFHWVAPDGYPILTRQIEYSGTAGETAVVPTQKKYFNLTNNALVISGGDFTPPDRTIGSLLKNTKSYQVLNTGPSAFFEALLADANRDGVVIPHVSRDNTPLLPGCYSSRIDTKIANRLAENTLVQAETFATLAWLHGARYPWAALDKAWRQLLYGQHHDALTGSDTENVNLDLLTSWREALDLAAEIRRNSTAHIASLASADALPSKKDARPIVVFNNLNWQRTEPVELTLSWPSGVASFAIFGPDKKQIPYQFISFKKNASGKITWARLVFIAAEIPSVGYSTYYAAPGVKPAVSPLGKSSKSPSIQTARYEITADPARGGGITSIKDIKSGKEFIDTSNGGAGNEIFSIKENAHKVEGPWSIHSTGQVWRTGDHPATVTTETGPVFSRIIVTSAPARANVKIFDGSDKITGEQEQEILPRLVRETIAYKNHPRIDFKTSMLGYKETDFLFKAGFPANIKNALPVFEERFAAVSRDKNDQDFLFYDFWREPGVKKGREYPAMNWVDMTAPPRLVFLDDDGYATSTFPLAIGEIVSDFSPQSLTMSNRLAGSFIRKGVTTTPTRDNKKRTNEYYGFRVSIGVESANKYSQSVIGEAGPEAAAALSAQINESGFGFLFANPAASITSTPDKKMIPVLIVQARDENSLADAVAQLTGDLEEHGNIILPASANPSRIDATIEDAGLALINLGLPGNSVEHDGTMTITLMRSSTGWPSGGQYYRNLETENWNHTFKYALLPHSGNWMSAKVWRAGHEFNNPLFPVIEKSQHPGALPQSMSFLKTRDTDMVISALKPKGFPYSDGRTPVASSQLVLRMYNPSGFLTNGMAEFNEPVKNVSLADLMENPSQKIAGYGKTFPVSADAFSIETYIFDAERTPTNGTGAKLGPDAEAISPVYSRYWDTNQGAAPMGFQPLALTLEPGAVDVAQKKMELRVTVANYSSDRKFNGKVVFTAPGDPIEPLKYDLEPGSMIEQKRIMKNFDPRALSRQFVTAETTQGGQRLYDALPFEDWKMLIGDTSGAEKPEFDDSGWDTVPLARFWSQGAMNAPVVWYRRGVVIPEGMGDRALHIERSPGATVTVYVNGEEIRTEKDGRSYQPLWAANVKPGEKNLFAFRVESPGGEATMWADALAGSEPLFSLPIARFEKERVAVKPGGSAVVKLSIVNPYDRPLEGTAQLVSPVETWQSAGAASLVSFAPALKNFSLQRGGSTTVQFTLSAPPDALPGNFWLMAKLIFAGRTSYTKITDVEVAQ